MAITWFCLWCVALASYFRFLNYGAPPTLPWIVAVWLCIVIGPCLSMGALFGNTFRGLQVGIGGVGSIAIILLLARVLAPLFG